MELGMHRHDYLIIPQIATPNTAPVASTTALGASIVSTAAFRADAPACARGFRDNAALKPSIVKEVEVAITCVADIPTAMLGMALAPRVAAGGWRALWIRIFYH